jgi:uncharacterized RDD family membrane protein YckC
MTEERFGGFWRRAVAYGIDKAILQASYVLIFIVGLLIRMIYQPDWHGMEMDLSDNFPDVGVIWIYYLMALFLDMVYFTWFHGSVGQTPGKMLLGLRVVQVTGESMTFGHAFLRWTGYLISKIAVYLGFLWIAFDRRKQGWHDKIAGTVVVTVKKGLDKESYII